MNKDVVCFGTGCHIEFFNVVTSEKTQFTANFPNGYGDGIRVIDGHRTSYTFAYAEYCKNPRLYVKNFPDFENITIFKGEHV